MGEGDFRRVTTHVKSVEKRDDRQLPSYVVEFENGLVMSVSEMQYKLYQEPKEGEEYTIIYTSKESPTILKAYTPHSIQKKTPLKNYGPWRLPGQVKV